MLKKYNAVAIEELESTRNLHEIYFVHDLHENDKTIIQHPIKMINSQITKNPILIKI